MGSTGKLPVLISGAGPVGLTLSLYLSQYGIKHLVLDKASQLTKHPQAHFINNRTMEVFRPLGGLSSDVSRHSPPLSEWRSFVYCESLLGRVFGQVDHFKGQPGPQAPHLSPEPLSHLAQSRLLPLLLTRARARGGGSCGEVRFDHAVTRVQERPGGGVVVTATNAKDGRAAQFEADYVVAADGAHSTIRKQLQVGLSGQPGLQHLINIHFTSPSLGRVAAQRPAMLYFVFNSDVVTVMVAHDIQRGEFVAQVPYFPPVQSPADFPPEVCKSLVRAAAGSHGLLDIAVHEARPWTMSALVADRYQALSGRVFLVGDAAHRFPPAGGFGMNTGVQDAHNLGWKLAAVLQGRAGQELLGTYESERQPIARANTALSMANWGEALQVPKALGLTPGAADMLKSTVAAVPLLPSALRRGLLEAGLALGRRQAMAGGPLGAWRQAELDRIFSQGESLRLQFPREDLGFRYAKGAVATDPQDVGAHAHAQQECAAARNAPFVPSSVPGCRLPHCWLELQRGSSSSGATAAAGPQRISSIDLPHLLASSATADAATAQGSATPLSSTPLPSIRLTLFTDMGLGPHNPWLQAAAQLNSEWQQQRQQGQHSGAGSDSDPLLAVVQVTPPGTPASSDHTPSQPLVAVDVEGRWHAVMGVPQGSVLLVRPDGHVAWRHVAVADGVGGAGADKALQQLRGVVQQVLGLQA